MSDDDGERSPRVRFVKRGGVAYVTLNRPHVLNALDLRTHEELKAVWDEFEEDDALRVAVLTGAGERAFSVGQDLKERARLDRSDPGDASSFGSAGRPGWPRLTERYDLCKPIIAKVRGYAYGGGFELVLACDIVVADTTASFALPEARLGLIAGAGGVFRLSKQVPFRVAMGHLLTAREISAERAFQIGLVNEVVEPSALDACVDRWARDIERCAPLAVRAAKEAATKGHSLPMEEAMSTHYRWEERRKNSQDAREGPAAFAEKRPPQWRAR